jgi:hypothetical protein
MSQTILEEMQKQAQGMCPEKFVCKDCINYKGNLACDKNVFIAFVGANMSSCSFYQWGITCAHCGLRT